MSFCSSWTNIEHAKCIFAYYYLATCILKEQHAYCVSIFRRLCCHNNRLIWSRAFPELNSRFTASPKACQFFRRWNRLFFACWKENTVSFLSVLVVECSGCHENVTYVSAVWQCCRVPWYTSIYLVVYVMHVAYLLRPLLYSESFYRYFYMVLYCWEEDI